MTQEIRIRKRSRLAVVAAMVLAGVISSACAAPRPSDPDRDRGVPSHRRLENPWAPRTGVQLVAGASMVGDDDLVIRDGGLASSGAEADLSPQPLLGAIAQHPFVGEDHRLGVEVGLLMGWRTDSASFASGSGGTVVKADLSLLLFDLFVGPFASTVLFDAVRAYVGAGPAVVFGWLDLDDDAELGGDTGSDWGGGLGWYARTGLELKVVEGTYLGVGVRHLSDTLEFDGGREIELDGLQAFLSYTLAF